MSIVPARTTAVARRTSTPPSTPTTTTTVIIGVIVVIVAAVIDVIPVTVVTAVIAAVIVVCAPVILTIVVDIALIVIVVAILDGRPRAAATASAGRWVRPRRWPVAHTTPPRLPTLPSAASSFGRHSSRERRRHELARACACAVVMCGARRAGRADGGYDRSFCGPCGVDLGLVRGRCSSRAVLSHGRTGNSPIAGAHPFESARWVR